MFRMLERFQVPKNPGRKAKPLKTQESWRGLGQVLAETVECVPEMVFVKEAENLTFTSVNRTAERLLGLPRSELIGRGDHDFFPPSQADHFVATDRKVLGGKKQVVVPEEELLTKSGETRYLRTTKIPILDETGTPRFLLGISQDITDEKRTRDALKKTEASLSEMFENAAFGIYLSTPEGRFISANPALVKLLGYRSFEELLELDIAQDVYVDRNGRQWMEDLHKGAVRFETETEWKKKSGKRIVVHLSVRQVFDDFGSLDHYEVFVQDLTHRRGLEEQLRHAQKMEALGELTGGIAHDFNNLLSVILLHLEILEDSFEDEREVREECMQGIGVAANRAAVITRQLLGFSRRAPISCAPTDLRALVKDLSGLLGRLLPENIRVEVEVKEPVRLIQADSGAVQQMVLNLANNARDAMPEGGQITLSVESVGSGPLKEEDASRDPAEMKYVALCVSDTGIGMDFETQERLFDPFFTTKNVGEGTGLGMAMVYGLIRQHGGRIRVESELGSGSRVCLLFPELRSSLGVPGRPGLDQLHPGDGEAILLVEDDSLLRETGKTILVRGGYRVTTARNGKEALDLLHNGEGAFDIVISDISLPDTTGAQLGKQFVEVLGEGRVLLTSGYEQNLDNLPNSCGFFPKPWKEGELLRVVWETLDTASKIGAKRG